MAHIVDVIEYEGDNSTFIWKHPCEDFNTMTQLIVHESQEAIFFMNGQALDLLGPGRHTLETQNIPLIGKLLNKVTGGNTPFHCEVYFINKTVQMGVKWGTDSKVRFEDPKTKVPLRIGACGEMNLAVSDSRKLLLKLVGTMNGIAWGDTREGFTKSLQSAFRPMISTAVKANLSNAIKSHDIDILDIDIHLEELSEILRQSLLGGFEEYGLTVPQFYITHVALPEEDINFKRIRQLRAVGLDEQMIQANAYLKTAKAEADATVEEVRRKKVAAEQDTQTLIAQKEAERELIKAQTEAQAAKMAGFAEAEVMAAKGYNQKDVLQADVQKAYAEGIGNMNINGGGGGVVGDMMGLSVGMAAAGAMAPQFGEMMKGFAPNTMTGTSSAEVPKPEAPAPEAKCAKCGAALPANAKFCSECGEKNAPAVPDGMIVCPGCGKTVNKGKFCLECGHKFVTVCPKCGKDIVAGAKFCLECGEKL